MNTPLLAKTIQNRDSSRNSTLSFKDGLTKLLKALNSLKDGEQNAHTEGRKMTNTLCILYNKGNENISLDTLEGECHRVSGSNVLTFPLRFHVVWNKDKILDWAKEEFLDRASSLNLDEEEDIIYIESWLEDITPDLLNNRMGIEYHSAAQYYADTTPEDILCDVGLCNNDSEEDYVAAAKKAEEELQPYGRYDVRITDVLSVLMEARDSLR